MKVTSFLGILSVLLSATVFVTWHHLQLLQKENGYLRKEFVSIRDMKNPLLEKSPASHSNDPFKTISRLIDQGPLKHKVVAIQPSENEVQVTLKNISQDELIEFMKALEVLDELNISQLGLSKDSPNTLSLSLTLQNK